MDPNIQEKYNQLKQELKSAKERAAACGQLYTIYTNAQSEFEKFCRENNLPVNED